jgi:transcription factor S
MIFCPKCGSILLPQKGKDNMLVKCKCGYKSEMENIVITEKIDEAKKIDVVDVEEQMHPIVDAECPKCSHDKAEFWTRQTRSADEAETRFFKCVKCSHIWREYS